MINKKIALSLMSIVAALSIMAGATLAFFSSSATSTGNAFGAGTLILQINDNNEPTPAPSVTASFGANSMKPGDTTPGFVSLDNTGSIDMNHITLTASQTANSTPSLAEVLDVTAAGLSTSSECTSPTDLLAGWQAQSGLAAPTTLSQLISKGEFNAIPSGLAAGTTKYLCMTFKMEDTASDSYQGATTTDTFSFIGKQSASQTP